MSKLNELLDQIAGAIDNLRGLHEKGQYEQANGLADPFSAEAQQEMNGLAALLRTTRQRISACSSAVSDLRARISELEKSLEGELPGEQKALAELEEELDQLKRRFDENRMNIIENIDSIKMPPETARNLEEIDDEAQQALLRAGRHKQLIDMHRQQIVDYRSHIRTFEQSEYPRVKELVNEIEPATSGAKLLEKALQEKESAEKAYSDFFEHIRGVVKTEDETSD